jgi:hypothetical protein
MTIELGTRITSGGADRLIEELVEHPGEDLVLDLDGLRRLELLAEPGVMAFLGMARTRSRSTRLRTDATLEGSSSDLSRLLVNTLGGVILAQLAAEVLDSSGADRRPSLVRRQAEHAVETSGYFGYGREWAAPMVDRFGGPPPAAMVGNDIGTEFDPLFRSWVSRMNLPDLPAAQLGSLIEFAYEAFDNCRRHGARDLDRKPLEGVRFVLLRAIYPQAGGPETEPGADAPEAVRHYLDRVMPTLGRREPVVELTVADCGVGIAASLHGATDIYDGDWETEAELTRRAFEAGATSRRSLAGAGRGLFKALRSSRALSGLVSLRCGRTRLSADCLAQQEVVWGVEEKRHVPGTSISVLFPWRLPTLFNQ